MGSLILAEGVCRYYGARCAVRDLTFTLERGDILGFLGPNGAGKTTSMRMLAGTLAPNSGTIRLNGVDLLDKPIEAKAALGFLPETPPLYRDFSVDEYLHYCAHLKRIPRSGVASSVVRAKHLCGLREMGRRLIGRLSKGYQQRVGIAQAILHEPNIVILDEPTVGLDPIQVREIRELIRDIGQDRGVILSTHVLPEVQSVCNRVQIINEGELVFSDQLDRLHDAQQPEHHVAALRGVASTADLESLPGIAAAQAIGSGRFRIRLSPETPADRVAAQLVGHGWGLLEWKPERKSLEQIFVDLTTAEP